LEKEANHGEKEDPGMTQTAQIGKRLSVVAMAGLALLCGCTIVTRNHGEVGLRYAGEIVFFSRATKTDGGEATIAVEIPSLEEWILAKAKTVNEETPTTEGTEPKQP